MDQLLSGGRGRLDGTAYTTMERIRAVFADSLHLNCSEEGLTHEEMLDEAASLDSIAVVEFLTAVEKEFGIELEPAVLEFEFLRDFGALASYIEERISRRSPPRPMTARSAANSND
jgi:acyl carrier protein